MHDDVHSIFARPRPYLKRAGSHSNPPNRPTPRRRFSESTFETRPAPPPPSPPAPAAHNPQTGDFAKSFRIPTIPLNTTTTAAAAAAAAAAAHSISPPAATRPPLDSGRAAANGRELPLETQDQTTASASTRKPALPVPPGRHPSQTTVPQAIPAAGAKRPLESTADSSSATASAGAAADIFPTNTSPEAHLRKRQRRDILSRRAFGALDLRSLSANNALPPAQPPSPLFFSNSPRTRPQLPPRFSTSDAAIKMLNRTHGEDQGIKTVTLPRATLGSPPSYRPNGSRSRYSSERKSQPRTIDNPDSPNDRFDQSPLINQIGITELLEQDDRPTFIVDLADTSNMVSTALNIIYVNASLRGSGSILDCISGRVGNDAPSGVTPTTYSQFKSWILGPHPASESAQTCLTYGTVSWTVSTLRRRIRIVSGTPTASTPQSVNWTSTKAPAGTLRTPDVAMPSSRSISAIEHGLATDYFGLGGMSLADKGLLHPPMDIVPSVETPETPSGAKDGRLHGDELELDSTGSLMPTPVFDLRSKENASPEGEVGFFDWTRLPISDNLPPHIRFARSRDWGATSLGPIETWSADLRQMCNLIMASPHPAAMYWGDDLVAIYNEAYVLLAGQKHPRLMGQSYREAWAEIWDEVKEVFANAQTTGEATMKDDDCLFIRRNDFLEETYFSWSIIPMVGGDGSVMGLYNPAFEKTRRKIAERRMLTLREVGERTATAREVKSFWNEVLRALECNDFDTPFVLLYSLYDDAESDGVSITSSSLNNSRQCVLEGSLGVPDGHIAAPVSVDFQTSDQGFIPAFREALKTNKPQVLNVDEGQLRPELLDGFEWRGFGDAARAVVICPIHPTTGESTLGFLAMGVNPRRPYDDDYNLFVQLLGRQLATSLASVVLFEEEIRRGQKAAKLAAIDRIELSEQLAARTAEAIESESRFTRMAEMAPVGMLIADSLGHIIYCNDAWFEITRVPRSEIGDRWIEYIHDEDKQSVQKAWSDVVHGLRTVSIEFRFKTPWIDRNGVIGPTWVLFSACPEPDSHGNLKSLFGSLTNISQQKWAEGLQKKKMEEAVELKRQQENFIDITSHEMRNPLSAILQCADEISSSLGAARAKGRKEVDASSFDDIIDAAHTITLCAQHQKRIVDDVLTMSKLDSHLLIVTPVDVQPLTVAQRALKMFEGELQTADIQMRFIVDPSFTELKVDWVRFDPSRVLQVLINLTTNAIKFTTTESKRTILVSIAASVQRPSESEKTIVDYIPNRRDVPDMTNSSGWGQGEALYIHFAVQDTGRGLTPEEKKLLFQRFSQASPRTHVQYGGSGLGLFISKELTELQGGQIGVASEAGRGSTFAFFVQAKRSTAPPEHLEHNALQPLQPLPPPPPPATMAHTIRKPALAPVAGTARAGGGATKTRDFAVSAVAAGSAEAGDKKEARAQGSSKETLKVLIVEDNLVNQRVLQKQLKKLGCVTHVANHGGEALDRLRECSLWAGKEGSGFPLSVVLMDQEMPVMDGLTCTRKIRELEGEGKFTAHVPIIAVTANARSEQIKTAMDAGMDDVVSKPFRIPELITKIEELIDRCHARPGAAPDSVAAAASSAGAM